MDLRPKVFIGSSREALPIARGIKTNLEEVSEVRIWDEDVFEPGQYTLEELLRFTAAYDFAIFVLSGDDAVISRGQGFTSPRDNVLLEAGMFYAALGSGRVFLFVSTDTPVKIPADLLGITIVTYRDPSDGNYRSAVATSSSRVTNAIIKRGTRANAHTDNQLRHSALHSFINLDQAKAYIKEACKNSADIRILSNKGLVFFGLDDSIVSLAEADDFTELRRLRLILLHPGSRWVNRGLMALRQHESLTHFKKELTSSHEIAESGMRKFAKMLNLHKSGIKYHKAEPYFRMVITNTKAFVSSYAEHPTTQVRDLLVYVFENQPGSLYAAFKRHFNDLWHNTSQEGEFLQDTIETEVSAGGILIGSIDNREFVALVMRDDGSWVLPKGHKEKSDESLQFAAVREVIEEIGITSENLEVVKPLDEYIFDETAQNFGSKKVTYLFLMRYIGEGLPKLKPDPDHLEAKWWPIDEPIPYMFYAYQRTLLAEVIKNEFGLEISLS